MKFLQLLLVMSLLSCGAKNNIFYNAKKAVSDTIGSILPAEVAPELSILTPAANSTNGREVTISGECFNAKTVEISNSELQTNPSTVNCIDDKYEAKVTFTNILDMITVVDVKAINETKFEVRFVEIEVKVEVPSVATHIELSYARADRIEVNWNSSISTDLALQGYKLEYKKSSDSDWSEVSNSLLTTTTKLIGNLESSTSYDFRVMAFNGNYSAPSSLTASTMPQNDFFAGDKIKAMNVGGATQSSLVAIESGDFYLNGSLLATLTKGQTHIFNSNSFDVVSSDKAFYVAGRLANSNSGVKKANVVWTTQDWSSKELNFTVNRSPKHRLSIVAFENSTVKVFKGATLLHTEVLNSDSGFNYTVATNGAYKIVSTGAVSAYIVSTRTGDRLEDPRPILPAATDIVGFPSRWGYVSSIADGALVSGNYSDDVLLSLSLATTDSLYKIDPPTNSDLFKGESLRLRSEKGLVATSYADRNGNCAAPFISRAMLRNTYAVNVSTEWAAFASIEPGVVTITKPDGSSSNITLSRSGTGLRSPYKARVTNLPAGSIIKSTAPMGAWYEPKTDTAAANDDETILFGFNL